MKDTKTSLVCSHCFKDSSVKITYLKNSTVKLTCENCGYTVRISSEAASHFSFTEWGYRLLTKPARTALEVKRDSLNFISTFPLRVITKPIRIARELEKSLL